MKSLNRARISVLEKKRFLDGCSKLEISQETMHSQPNRNAVKNFVPINWQLAFLTLCDQATNPPFLGGKIIELAKFCFMNKRFETNLSFFSKPVIVSHCV